MLVHRVYKFRQCATATVVEHQLVPEEIQIDPGRAGPAQAAAQDVTIKIPCGVEIGWEEQGEMDVAGASWRFSCTFFENAYHTLLATSAHSFRVVSSVGRAVGF